MPKTQKLKQKDFKIMTGDVNYFQRIFGIHNEYEIALEPCDRGFDVSLYRKVNFDMKRVGMKECTDLDGYTADPFHTKERAAEAWEKALQKANEMIDVRLPKGIER